MGHGAPGPAAPLEAALRGPSTQPMAPWEPTGTRAALVCVPGLIGWVINSPHPGHPHAGALQSCRTSDSHARSGESRPPCASWLRASVSLTCTQTFALPETRGNLLLGAEKSSFSENQTAVPKRCRAGGRVSESIPACRTPLECPAGCWGPAAGAGGCRMSTPLLGLSPAPGAALRRRHEPPAFLFLFFTPILLWGMEPAPKFGLFISLSVFLSPPLCVSAQHSAVAVTDKCRSPILAEVLGHGWAPTGPEGLQRHRGAGVGAEAGGSRDGGFGDPAWGPGWWQMRAQGRDTRGTRMLRTRGTQSCLWDPWVLWELRCGRWARHGAGEPRSSEAALLPSVMTLSLTGI